MQTFQAGNRETITEYINEVKVKRVYEASDSTELPIVQDLLALVGVFFAKLPPYCISKITGMTPTISEKENRK